jgi:hypothetical protein
MSHHPSGCQPITSRLPPTCLEVQSASRRDNLPGFSVRTDEELRESSWVRSEIFLRHMAESRLGGPEVEPPSVISQGPVPSSLAR